MPRCCLLALDAAMITIAFVAAYFTRYDVLNGVQFTTPFMEEQLSSFRELQVGRHHWHGRRLRAQGTVWTTDCRQLVQGVLGDSRGDDRRICRLLSLDYLVRKTDIALDSRSRSLVIFAWLFIILFVSLARVVVSFGVTYLYCRGIGLTNLLVVGSGRLLGLMMQQIAATPNLGYRVVGFIYDQEGPSVTLDVSRRLASIGDLERMSFAGAHWRGGDCAAVAAT